MLARRIGGQHLRGKQNRKRADNKSAESHVKFHFE